MSWSSEQRSRFCVSDVFIDEFLLNKMAVLYLLVVSAFVVLCHGNVLLSMNKIRFGQGKFVYFDRAEIKDTTTTA